MDRLYEWVDNTPQDAGKGFSVRRVGKLFIAMMLASALAGLPVELWWLAVKHHQQAKEDREHQEKLDKAWQQLVKDSKEGKTDEAFQRLTGVKPADAKLPADKK